MKQRQVSSLRRAGVMIEDKEEGKEDVETTRKLSLSGRMTLGQRNKKVVLLVVPEPRTQATFAETQATMLKRLLRFETPAINYSPRLLISLIQGLCYLCHLLPLTVTFNFPKLPSQSLHSTSSSRRVVIQI